MVEAMTRDGSAVERAAVAGEALLAGRDPWADLPSDTARAIVLAGVAAFAQRGFHGTNLGNITKGVGLSTAALYVHFSSKEDLLFSISKRGYRVSLAIIDGATEVSDPAEALRTLVYAFTRWQAEWHTTARIVQYEYGALSPEHREELLALRRCGERKVRALIARGMEQGVFAEGDKRGMSTGVMSLALDVARWYEPDSPYTPDELGRLYCDLAARMVGIHDES